jgi:hypothetical protein
MTDPIYLPRDGLQSSCCRHVVIPRTNGGPIGEPVGDMDRSIPDPGPVLADDPVRGRI